MRKTTRSAIAAILATDETVSAEVRAAVLAAADGEGGVAGDEALPGRPVKIREFCARFGVSRSTVRNLMARGTLRAVRYKRGARAVGITRESVNDYLRGATALAE